MENVWLPSLICDYWSKAKLCSPLASTSNADPDLSCLDNQLESDVLSKILAGCNGDRCLDVGAGYGRFTKVLLNNYKTATLIEGADGIFGQLVRLWGEHQRVTCLPMIFEDFKPSTQFDLIFTSGVLYLYDDAMLESFILKAKTLLSNGGRLIVRDFVSNPPRKISSAFITNSFCFYRNINFWINLCSKMGLEVTAVRRTKPQLKLLRNKYILFLLRCSLLKSSIMNSKLTHLLCSRFGDYRLCAQSINTVFIEIRLKCTQ